MNAEPEFRAAASLVLVLVAFLSVLGHHEWAGPSVLTLAPGMGLAVGDLLVVGPLLAAAIALWPALDSAADER